MLVVWEEDDGQQRRYSSRSIRELCAMSRCSLFVRERVGKADEESWARLLKVTSPLPDPARRAAAHVPEDIAFVTKPQLARAIAQRHIEPAHVIAWSTWRRAHQATAQKVHIEIKPQL